MGEITYTCFCDSTSGTEGRGVLVYPYIRTYVVSVRWISLFRKPQNILQLINPYLPPLRLVSVSLRYIFNPSSSLTKVRNRPSYFSSHHIGLGYSTPSGPWLTVVELEGSGPLHSHFDLSLDEGLWKTPSLSSSVYKVV